MTVTESVGTGFTSFRLDNGINLFVYPTKKFKTNTIKVIIHHELGEDASKVALIPNVLRRGCAPYPNTPDLMKRLEDLYGAVFRADVGKKGEQHLIGFDLEIANEKFVPGVASSLIKDGVELLHSVLWEPLVDNGGFKEEYLNQEKNKLRLQIEGLINDKGQYSIERCVEEMCSTERYGIHRLGKKNDLDKVENVGLSNFWKMLRDKDLIDMFVVGDIAPNEALDVVSAIFNDKRNPEATSINTEVIRKADSVREIKDSLDVTQGKLAMGFRTGVTMADPQFYPLRFYNGVLGSFPHSKLFQNVREKASLAYYVFSRMEYTKGIMLIGAGIEMENYAKARSIIEEQLEDIKAGKITDYEFECTQKAMESNLKISQDSPGAVCDMLIDGRTNNRQESLNDMLRQLSEVTKQQIIEVANQITLDTVYFMTNKDAKGGTNSVSA